MDALIEPSHLADTASPQKLRVEVLTGLSDLRLARAELDALCDDLCEENVFYEPWMIEAAMVHLAPAQSLSILCFYGTERPNWLCGFFPLARTELHPLLPLRIYRMWQHLHCLRCTPLIRNGFGEACWNALFDWLERQPSFRRILDLRCLSVGGEVERTLRRVLEAQATTRFVVLEQESAFLSIGSDSEEILRQAMSGTTLAKLRRQQRRLAESGELLFADIGEEPDQDRLVSEFLQLEASGWKGRKGSALACRNNEANFFRAVIAEAQARGQLSFPTLRLDGQLIAARNAFLSRSGCFCFKTAYDETYSKFSPGILLQIEFLRRMHDPNDPVYRKLRWADSCAAPGTSPAYRCWPERKTIRNYRIACGRMFPRMVLALWSLLHQIHLKMQRSKADRAGNCAKEGALGAKPQARRR